MQILIQPTPGFEMVYWKIFNYNQGRIFPKIQPTTICRIELTSDKNQVKTQ